MQDCPRGYISSANVLLSVDGGWSLNDARLFCIDLRATEINIFTVSTFSSPCAGSILFRKIRHHVCQVRWTYHDGEPIPMSATIVVSVRSVLAPALYIPYP